MREIFLGEFTREVDWGDSPGVNFRILLGHLIKFTVGPLLRLPVDTTRR